MSRLNLFSLFFACSTFASATLASGFIREPSGTPILEPEASVQPVKILTWNISMRPFLVRADHNAERAHGIAEVLIRSDYDIIVFEEAFDDGARDIIGNRLKDRYPFFYGPANRAPGAFICDNSGIWVVSRIPLRLIREIEFTRARGADRFAHKGAMLLEGEYLGCRFQLVAVHIQSDKFSFHIRGSQMKEMRSRLAVPFFSDEMPQLICGDLNTDRSDSSKYQFMLAMLGAVDGQISGTEKASFASPGNELTDRRHTKPRQIDYILVCHEEYLSSITRRIVTFRHPWGNGRHSLSDHNGVEAVIYLMHPAVQVTALNF